ncbi:MarR family winged helix-turn-helix transcriptional regulator [Butyricicoccus sp. Marseille-Q5471]|uniref:MarR family winged helix-turn-helix transcriptional regulator n=1 Tax=Butyricicoccus sp. Marseille-Q5471 TaxID=3039493 RepID=UPI0024BC8EB5|nr:MarR family transcriptional regulator [Butyricicoccus sp. Marseille-Q5471]
MSEKQKNTLDPVSYYLGHLHRLSTIYLSKQFADLSIGFGQYLFLMHLYGENGLRHEELTARLHVDKSTTTRAITKLYEAGYVTVKQEDIDKRKFRIYLTDKAIEQKKTILKIADEWEARLVECLEPEEQKELFRLLKKMADNQPE